MTQRKPRSSDRPDLSFDPAPVRARHDGWTSERQIAFIEALAECGCVLDACRRVGMSAESAYALRRRPGSRGFRAAWENALALAIRRISDGAFSRALHGVAVPHYYKGELVGEHRRYDERLTMFLLRYRDPLRYAKSLDRLRFQGEAEWVADDLERSIENILEDACEAEDLIAAESGGEGESSPDVP